MKTIKKDLRKAYKKLLHLIVIGLYMFVGLIIYEKAINYRFDIIDAVATSAYFFMVVQTDWGKYLKEIFE
jgi:hypothetical protein